MKIGFVTFCTEDWVEILDNLVDSVLFFSKYEITVYSINFDYFNENDRVKVKRIDIPTLSMYEICKQKIYSSVDSEYDVGLILDTDMIVTPEIDNIFEDNLERVINSEYPLFARHPNDAFKNAKEVMLDHVRIFTNNLPKHRYVYASFLFSKKNKWFLSEVLNEMNSRGHILGEDEMIINCLLTKYQVDYDIGYNYLPNGTHNILNGYLNESTNIDDITLGYLKYDCPVKFYIFHGHEIKNVKHTKNYLINLKNDKFNRK
jgi:hypothetical protein